MDIEQLLARRSDLSTFLVHLTRAKDSQSALDALKGILREQMLIASSAFGMAVDKLTASNLATDSQKAVCFTETPLQNVSLLTEQIDGRNCQFEPYGIAIARKQGRRLGINPVWYLDITPGHDWLTGPINGLIDEAIGGGAFEDQHISKVAPYFEQMGTYRGSSDPWVRGYRKEFWWEREWRHVGNLSLPSRYIILCPSSAVAEIKEVVQDLDDFDAPSHVSYVDPRWSLEMMLGRLAGFDGDDLGAF